MGDILEMDAVEGIDNMETEIEEVGKIEKEHEERYKKLLASVKEKKVFMRDDEVVPRRDFIVEHAGYGNINIDI